MSKSIVFYHGRDDVLHIVDPETLPHFNDHPPVFDFVFAIIKAGYLGVVVDEKQLANGRFIHCLSVNQGTPEGRVIQGLVTAVNDGEPLPSIELVMAQIKKLYNEIGGCHA